MIDWQTIDTAPKDGTEIIICTHHDGDELCDTFTAVQTGYWDSGHDSSDPMWCRQPGWIAPKIGKPTHWIPLPAAPASVGAA